MLRELRFQFLSIMLVHVLLALVVVVSGLVIVVGTGATAAVADCFLHRLSFGGGVLRLRRGERASRAVHSVELSGLHGSAGHGCLFVDVEPGATLLILSDELWTLIHVAYLALIVILAIAMLVIRLTPIREQGAA